MLTFIQFQVKLIIYFPNIPFSQHLIFPYNTLLPSEPQLLFLPVDILLITQIQIQLFSPLEAILF